MKMPSKDQILKWGGLILVLLVVFFLYMGRADAGTATVTWQNPTQRTDGSSFPSSAIGGTRVEWGTCSGTSFGSMLGTQTAPGAVTSLGPITLDPGTYCFRAFTVTTTGVSSGPSAVVSKVVAAPEVPPNPPTLTTVSTVAYEYRQYWYGERMVSVGRVARGQSCGDPRTLRRITYNALQAGQVTLGRGYRGGPLYGRCA